MRIDCHLHTRFSDGVLAPAELRALVERKKLRAWAVTDHDSCSAWRELRGCDGLIPGVEITGSDEGREVHVVGLGIDPDQPAFERFLAGIRQLRSHRFALLVEHAAACYGRELDALACLDRHSDSPSRVHLARALRSLGCVGNLQQAFNDCLADQHLRTLDLPAFPDLAAVRHAIHAAGGVAILAHPGVHGSIDRIHQLMRSGGLDGLEVNHPNLDPLLRQGLASLCEQQGWLRSCGSDFHWPGKREVGGFRISRAEAEGLMQAVGRGDATVANSA